jgi:CubicO group peptidase (beta-lactamase class C family)
MSGLPDKLAAYVEEIQRRWGIPDISISLLDGRTQSFGSSDNHTYMIASNTKLFTSVALGILVDEGKFNFDSKLSDLFPGFSLSNKHSESFATLADALSHSTGCTSGNIGYAYRFDSTNEDILENICKSRCHNELRSTFAYDNRWFSVGALIVERFSGQPYSTFAIQRILEPLGMTSSTFDTHKVESVAVVPNVTLDDGETSLDLPFWPAQVKSGHAGEGAFGLFSTSPDLAKWISYLQRTVQGRNTTEDPKIYL